MHFKLHLHKHVQLHKSFVTKESCRRKIPRPQETIYYEYWIFSGLGKFRGKNKLGSKKGDLNNNYVVRERRR